MLRFRISLLALAVLLASSGRAESTLESRIQAQAGTTLAVPFTVPRPSLSAIAIHSVSVSWSGGTYTVTVEVLHHLATDKPCFFSLNEDGRLLNSATAGARLVGAQSGEPLASPFFLELKTTTLPRRLYLVAWQGIGNGSPSGIALPPIQFELTDLKTPQR